MKRLAVIGATGSVGGNLVAGLMRSRLLNPHDELVLVARGQMQSDSRLLAERIDLLDAFDEQEISIRFCPDVSELEADVVVMTAGATVSAEHPTRRDLAAANIGLFRHLGEACVARLPKAVFIIVSNPVELAVEIFSRFTEARNVVGMGAQQDSLRFSRCLAEKLGLTRHQVRASVFGEHGAAMFPVWSSVELLTEDMRVHDLLATIQASCRLQDLDNRVRVARAETQRMVAAGQVQQAYQFMMDSAPDVRIFIEPFITATVLHSTPNATSNATLKCVEAALSEEALPVHAQVRGAGYMGIEGVCGLPVLLDRNGWRPVSGSTLSAEEMDRLRACGRSIAGALELALDAERSDATA